MRMMRWNEDTILGCTTPDDETIIGSTTPGSSHRGSHSLPAQYGPGKIYITRKSQ